jgi:phosphoribosylanthranilate isomerase
MWRVKVCGLTSIEDAEFAFEEGADALGFVLEPSSPRCLTDRSVVAFSFEGTLKVGVFRDFLEDEDLLGFDVVQAVGGARDLGKPWMPVFRPKAGQGVEEWLAATEGWTWCLLDPFHAGLGGGTGEQLDWDLAAEFVGRFGGRVILAGGLGADNVREAILKVKPFGVDASSRLESAPGVKDGDLVSQYVSEAWEALSEVHQLSPEALAGSVKELLLG